MKKLTAAEQIERWRDRRRVKKVSRGLRATLKKIDKLKRRPTKRRSSPKRTRSQRF